MKRLKALLLLPAILLTSCASNGANDPFDTGLAYAMASVLSPDGKAPAGFQQAIAPAPVIQTVTVKEEPK